MTTTNMNVMTQTGEDDMPVYSYQVMIDQKYQKVDRDLN